MNFPDVHPQFWMIFWGVPTENCQIGWPFGLLRQTADPDHLATPTSRRISRSPPPSNLVGCCHLSSPWSTWPWYRRVKRNHGVKIRKTSQAENILNSYIYLQYVKLYTTYLSQIKKQSTLVYTCLIDMRTPSQSVSVPLPTWKNGSSRQTAQSVGTRLRGPKLPLNHRLGFVWIK